MLDVLLVLLVIFMASIQARRTMDVQLPAPCVGTCRGGDTPIVLEVLPGRHYRLNSAPIAEADLLERLRAVYAGRPDKVLQVAGSRSAVYQDVLDAMDVARGAGVQVIGVPSSDLTRSR
jgi:biopolymer transport protein ExbD